MLFACFSTVPHSFLAASLDRTRSVAFRSRTVCGVNHKNPTADRAVYVSEMRGVKTVTDAAMAADEHCQRCLVFICTSMWWSLSVETQPPTRQVRHVCAPIVNTSITSIPHTQRFLFVRYKVCWIFLSHHKSSQRKCILLSIIAEETSI